MKFHSQGARTSITRHADINLACTRILVSTSPAWEFPVRCFEVEMIVHRFFNSYLSWSSNCRGLLLTLSVHFGFCHSELPTGRLVAWCTKVRAIGTQQSEKMESCACEWWVCVMCVWHDKWCCEELVAQQCRCLVVIGWSSACRSPPCAFAPPDRIVIQITIASNDEYWLMRIQTFHEMFI